MPSVNPFPSRVDATSPVFTANLSAWSALTETLRARLGGALAGGGAALVDRHRQRGKIPVRDRIDLLLDTGSPFGGMGSSREMTIAALAEPALMLGLFTSALAAGSLDLGAVVRSSLVPGALFRPSDILALSGLFLVLIAETGRIPVDNPATHLELTMIHEAMVLEYAGPDLALVEWASALKELLYITLLIDLSIPIGTATTIAAAPLAIAATAWAAKVSVFALAITLVETTNAKLRLFRVPELVAVSLGLGFIALAIRFL